MEKPTPTSCRPHLLVLGFRDTHRFETRAGRQNGSTSPGSKDRILLTNYLHLVVIRDKRPELHLQSFSESGKQCASTCQDNALKKYRLKVWVAGLYSANYALSKPSLIYTKIDWMIKHLRHKEPFIRQDKFLQSWNFINDIKEQLKLLSVTESLRPMTLHFDLILAFSDPQTYLFPSYGLFYLILDQEVESSI